MDLILPNSFRSKRSTHIDPKRFRGYAKHLPCGGEAFWFTKFGKAWFDYEFSEIHFEDGQIKFKNKPIEEFKCPHCHKTLEGPQLMLVKIIQDDEADAIHKREHAKTKMGEICELCGDRKKP